MAERELLERVLEEATGFLDGLDDRRVPSADDVDAVAKVLGGVLSEQGTDPLAVIEELIAGAEPGLVAMPSGPPNLDESRSANARSRSEWDYMAGGDRDG